MFIFILLVWLRSKWIKISKEFTIVIILEERKKYNREFEEMFC